MTQQTLLGEIIEEKSEVKKKVKQDEDFETDDEHFERTIAELKSDEEQFGSDTDKYGWEQLKDIKGKDVGQNYIDIQLMSETDLDGTKYYVSVSETSEHPLNMLGSSWGSGGGFNPNKLEEIKAFFDGVTERKKECIKEVYRKFTKEETEIAYEHDNAYYYFRLIPAKNFFVIIDDELVDMIKKKGFDFEKWYDEYKALPENEATNEHWENALEILNLYKKGDKIVKKLEDNGEQKNDLSMFLPDDIEKDTDKLGTLKQIADEIKEREKKNGVVYYSYPYERELKNESKI